MGVGSAAVGAPRGVVRAMAMLEDTLTEDDLALCLGALMTPQQLSAAKAVCWRWCRLARGAVFSFAEKLLFTQATELSLKERDRPIYFAPMENEAGYYNDAELQPPCSKWGSSTPSFSRSSTLTRRWRRVRRTSWSRSPAPSSSSRMVTWEGDVVASHATRAALRVLLEKRGKPKADERGCDEMEMLINGITMSAGWQEQNLVAHVLFINTERERAFAVTPLQGLEMSKRLPDHDDVDYCLKDWEAALAEDAPQGVNPEMRFIVKARKQRELEQAAEHRRSRTKRTSISAWTRARR